MTLTKADMTEQLIDELEVDKWTAKSLIDDFFEEIRVALEQGEPVKLSGFGNFDLHDKVERPGRNPKTKEPVLVSARRVVTFRPGGKLKTRVRG